ncbi:hypothetical protein EMCG_06945 [[Emmonsia] crescens]|uniref:Uncharacterized protein n=1 Tax=[Emmonsia] crescens TaxID=73230 RepID=A0A0G2IA12_9EURO|nr:hypothetical protein EMCG_06945 [Emmonsia crescens UAMH 3008]
MRLSIKLVNTSASSFIPSPVQGRNTKLTFAPFAASSTQTQSSSSVPPQTSRTASSMTSRPSPA